MSHTCKTILRLKKIEFEVKKKKKKEPENIHWNQIVEIMKNELPHVSIHVIQSLWQYNSSTVRKGNAPAALALTMLSLNPTPSAYYWTGEKVCQGQLTQHGAAVSSAE